MDTTEPTETPRESPAPAAPPPRRPLRRRVMHVVRRGHLYLGLFLLPWAILYGATGFLFNHPTAFADAPTASFGPSELAGTPMSDPPPPGDVAGRVVAVLNDRAKGGSSYSLVDPGRAKYTREFAFATVKAHGREVSVLIDVAGKGGTVRSREVPPQKSEERAPFAVGGPKGGRGERGGPPRAAPPADPLPVEAPLHERVKAAVPVVLERTGFPGGEVVVTSVPDLTFLMSDGTREWQVTYNALAGSVSGKPAADSGSGDELSTRRFLTRLHVAHGYPGEPNAKWFWAVFVDVMAFVMVFWGVSGIFMWWQIRATRKAGLVVMLLSAAAVTMLGFGMHEVLAPR